MKKIGLFVLIGLMIAMTVSAGGPLPPGTYGTVTDPATGAWLYTFYTFVTTEGNFIDIFTNDGQHLIIEWDPGAGAYVNFDGISVDPYGNPLELNTIAFFSEDGERGSLTRPGLPTLRGNVNIN